MKILLAILICKLLYVEKNSSLFGFLNILFTNISIFFFSIVTEMTEIVIGKMTRDRERRSDANTNQRGKRIEIVTSGTRDVR